ncbi:MAG: murein hydrolase activator EnvC family protein [Caulobacteraceae bacterium]
MKSSRRPFLAAAFLCLLAGAALAADPVVSSLRGALGASQQDRANSEAQARSARDDLIRFRSELAELQALEAASRQGGARGGSGSKEARLSALHAREAALEAEYAREQASLARLLGALQLYRRSPPPALMVTPAKAKDAVRAAILIRAMEPELARRARVAALALEQIRVLRRAAAAANADLFASESALADRKAELEGLVMQSAEAERLFDAQSRAAQAEASSLAQRLQRMGASPDAADASGAAPSRLIPPVTGNLLQRFGQSSAGGQRSEGLTWSAAPDSTVRAPAGGRIDYAGPVKGWGGVLILRLSGGYHVVLTGVERLTVSAGQTVRAGQMLGRTSAMGERSQLHLEVRRNGAPQDPARWLGSTPRAAG